MLRLKAFQSSLYKRFKVIALDYMAAAEGTIQTARKKPVSALFYSGCAVLGFVCYKKVPSEASYIATLVESSNDLLLCGSERNKMTDNYIQTQLQHNAQGMLRYDQFGLFSVVYHSEHDKDTRSYKSQCKYANPRWHEAFQRVVDVGFLGRWWRLNYMMTDYDVDFNEVPKEFHRLHEKILDSIKTVFGISYYNNLISHPIKTTNYYVYTAAEESSDKQ